MVELDSYSFDMLRTFDKELQEFIKLKGIIPCGGTGTKGLKGGKFYYIDLELLEVLKEWYMR